MKTRMYQSLCYGMPYGYGSSSVEGPYLGINIYKSKETIGQKKGNTFLLLGYHFNIYKGKMNLA